MDFFKQLQILFILDVGFVCCCLDFIYYYYYLDF